jgi:tRNA (cmo5U34)-methyltransferase
VTTINRWTEPEHARQYLANRDTIPHRVEGLAVLLEIIGDGAQRVLDLGTGDGDTLALVLAQCRGVRAGVAVDFQPAMLERARARFAADDRVTVVEHNLDDPLPDLGRFDLVVSSFAIHHLAPERQRALYAEVFDRLEPGGRFANLEHVTSPTEALHGEFLAELGVTEDDPSNRCVDLGSHFVWLQDAGFVEFDCFWKWRELALVAGVRP